MLTVILYGFLAEKYGRLHKVSAKTPAEVIRAFCANYQDFKDTIIQDGQAHYKVLAGGENRSSDDALHIGTSKTIKIVPIVAGKGGFGKMLLGAALIVASFYLPGTTYLSTMSSLSFSASGIASGIGFSLLLGGVSQMLFSAPKAQTNAGERPENKPSYSFAGAVNVTGQGNPVPVCYGKMRVGSQVISTGLSVAQL
ncbi:MAG: tail assembly protein [Hydrogenophaga sp.]|nr:tail assembly protein [Hydrogenophaga sp.]